MGLFRQIAQLEEARRPFAIATVVTTEGSCPVDAGARLVFVEDGRSFGTVGGGRLEEKVKERCREAILKGKTELLTFELDRKAGLMACGGRVKIFIESFQKGKRLIIVGAGHVGMALCELAIFWGVDTIICDRDPRALSKDRLPQDVRRVMVESARALFDELSPEALDMVVIATGSHEADFEMLKQAIKTRAGYVGLLGSKKKRDSFFKRLREEGMDESFLKKVRCPVGLSIGAKGPREIAFSIMAELIRHFRSKDAG